VTIKIMIGSAQIGLRTFQIAQGEAHLRVTLPAAMLARLSEDRRGRSLRRRRGAESDCAEANDGRQSRDDYLISVHDFILWFGSPQ